MMESLQGIKRTHMATEVSVTNVGDRVTLMGWVDARRDHGGLIFVDLRDRSGIIQLVFSPEVDQDSFLKAEKIRGEYVLAAIGEVRRRSDEAVNPKLETGQIEVYITELRVLNAAKTPPFYIEEGIDVDENLRLRYRYLDLRRPDMQRNLILRHKVAKAARDFLDKKGFLEIETPMLTKSSPEGARDYLVPSRVNPGRFYALPQSPQIFKQLLMVSGVDKYFQIVRCFRDEDLRADRQPEFTQIDMEMSFVDVEDVLTLMEEMIAHTFSEAAGIEIEKPFPRLTYREAMDRYGSDKPDLRFELELQDFTGLAAASDFKVFAAVAAAGGQVRGINAKGCADFTRKEIDDLTKFVSIYGAKGLAYIVVTEEGLKSPILKFFKEEEINAMLDKFGAEPGDLLFFVADKPSVVAAALGALREELARKKNLIDPGVFKFAWVVEFPLVEYDEEERRYVAIHHPFTSPFEEDYGLMETDPGSVRARAYDMVLNGVELGGGSIRIHRRDIQEKMFSLLGLSEEEAKDKFGYLLEAFEYGTPPHGGIAFGLDRMIMLMAGKNTIRDVIPFPKTQSATDLMTQAPSEVAPKQLQELHMRLNVAKAKK
ncbi:aspartate--tRNA ligase [Phosphitispora fastidiosa]|uniref:aspartate--tRNA ligase n=1 Tax=Phosphitispora fastidiosa TaxID=2837202 RepID=UPI001E5AAA3D|nr:aspartate--tRNA ligase [Phosphitispora fastidiosa]MBU7007890.1 aspartyl-tRNA synthetase [Phosphitispora fastidiosa]